MTGPVDSISQVRVEMIEITNAMVAAGTAVLRRARGSEDVKTALQTDVDVVLSIFKAMTEARD